MLLRNFIENSVEINIVAVEKIESVKTGKVNFIINEMSEDFQKLKGMSHE